MSRGSSLSVRQQISLELLRYYYSSCVNHSIYILSLAVAFFGSLTVFNTSFSFPMKIDSLLVLHLGKIYLALVTSIFFVGECYLILRLIWWGQLANACVQVPHEFLESCTEDFNAVHYLHVDYTLGERREPPLQRKTLIMGLISQVRGSHLRKFVVIWLVIFILLVLHVYLLDTIRF